MRSAGIFSTRYCTSASVSPLATLSSTTRPLRICPTILPSTSTEARVTLWRTAFTCLERAFQPQQAFLHAHAAGKAAQRPVAGDHAVAGHQERHRIGAARPADGARRLGLADLAR